MRRPFLWALLAVVVGAVLLGRPSNPAAPPPSRAPRGPALSPPTPEADSPTAPSRTPERNIFRYQDEESTLPLSGSLEPAAASLPPALLPSPPPTIRLVGLLERGHRSCAAFWIAGEVVVLAAGEEAEGYRLLSLDEAEGVRLRAPSGEEIKLPPPGE